MKIPTSWLKKHIEFEKTPAEISELLTLAGLEVEKVDREIFNFSDVVTALVKEVYPHPHVDKLKVALVFDGKKQHKVVCGAPNCEAGKKVALAKVGSILQRDSDNPLEIQAATIRDIPSAGMLCSKKELGISNDHSGIYILPDDVPLGVALIEYLKDPTFDIALTPNLGYCRSVIGIARELGAQIDRKITPIRTKLEEDENLPLSEKIHIANEDHENCLQYSVRMIQGVEVGPSPAWLRDLLEKAGYQSFNNIVDVTNFVMHEMGQPLHAFDYDKIQSKEIVLRAAEKGETITTLDGEDRSVTEGTLLICDDKKPIAIAGVMGGADSAISESTHTVLLEAAQFNHMAIRKASKSLGLRTESSARFENEIDPDGVLKALDRAAFLLQEVAGGRILKGVASQSPKPYRPRFISARLSKINSLLGLKLSLSEVESYLSRLEIPCSSDCSDLLQIKVPSWRNDIRGEIDIVEEIARIYGYNNIARGRVKYRTSLSDHHPSFLLQRKIRSKLVARGLQEFLTCSLISPKLCDLEMRHELFRSEYIPVLHAKSVDQSILRPSLLPGLLTSIKNNQNYGRFDIQAFEVGNVHFKEKGAFTERPSLGIVLAGRRRPYHYETKPKEVDFFDLKGVVENLLETVLVTNYLIEESEFEAFHPSRQAVLKKGENSFAVLGEVHPSSLKKLDIRSRLYFAEIDLTLLHQFIPKHPSFSSLPQYPSSERDWTVTMKKKTPLGTLQEAIDHITSPLLKEAYLLDIYQDPSIGEKKQNITFRFTYRSDEKTLSDEEVEKEHGRIIKMLLKIV